MVAWRERIPSKIQFVSPFATSAKSAQGRSDTWQVRLNSLSLEAWFQMRILQQNHAEHKVHGIESFERHFRKYQRLRLIGSTYAQASADPCRFRECYSWAEARDWSVGRPLLALRTPSAFKIRSHCQCGVHGVEDGSGGYCGTMHQAWQFQLSFRLGFFPYMHVQITPQPT